MFARAAAACAAGCRVTISTPPDAALPAVRALDNLTDSWAGAIEFLEETDAQLAVAIRAGKIERLRTTRQPREEILRAAHEAGVHIASEPALAEGRIELLRYVREQSLSHAYHRYGNLGARSAERRRDPA